METVVQIVESKKEEVVEKIVEQVDEKKVDEVMDKVEDTVEQAIENISEKVEKAIEELSAKVDLPPQVEKVIDILEDQLDGRQLSCACFGWLVALRITRKSKQTPPTKSADEVKIPAVLSSPDSQATEQRPPTAPQ
jgi:uncharacterized protein (UPF0210 family)